MFENILFFILSSIIIVVVIIIDSEVFCRYFLNSSLIWPPEVSRFLFIWLVFIGAGYVSFKKKHLVMYVFLNKINNKQKRINVELLNLTLTCLLLTFLIIYGFKILRIVYINPSMTTEISLAFIYISLPIGSIIMLFYALKELKNLINDRRKF